MISPVAEVRDESSKNGDSHSSPIATKFRLFVAPFCESSSKGVVTRLILNTTPFPDGIEITMKLQLLIAIR